MQLIPKEIARATGTNSEKINRSCTTGFTLIELLIVIAIIATLSVVVIVTLNPAELLRQARDSNRISDLNTMKSAISLFLADTSSSTGLGTFTNCYVSLSGDTSAAGDCTNIFVTGLTVVSTTATNGRKVDGSGWIPVNFTAVGSGSPIGSLPYDPTNSGDNIYFYRASSTASTFKLAAKLESTKYVTTQALPANDGGNSASFYEAGTDLTM